MLQNRTQKFSLIAILFCFLSFHFAFAQSKSTPSKPTPSKATPSKTNGKTIKNDSLELAGKFLEFTCKITNQKKILSPIDVILYSNNKVIDHQVLDKKYRFIYYLRRDTTYILQISCPFYITRYVLINTAMPRKMQGSLSYVHDMDMELMEQPKTYYAPDVNSDILDEPITIIRYISQKDIFNVDPKYTRKMRRELRMFKKSIDKYKDEESQKH